MTGLPNNEQKTQGPLRIGLIADGPGLDSLAAVIDACLLIQPLGQAGMPPSAGLPEVPRFEDPRVLLAQPGLEAVMLATSTRNDVALATMASERGLHVWRLPPLARSFAEATEVAARVKKLATVYRVASWWEYVTDHVWHELQWPADFTPLFSDLRVSVRGPLPTAWRARLADAAGGALANAGYSLLEALVAVRGLPDRVAGVIGKCRQGATGPARETEDTAAAILHYADGGTAVVRATWDLPPFEQQMTHHGRTNSAALTDEEVVLTDAEGNILDRRPLPGEFVASELLRFVEFVRGQARDRATAPLERHLAVNALLEAAYLAARTGHPESPRKFYQVQGWPEPRT